LPKVLMQFFRVGNPQPIDSKYSKSYALRYATASQNIGKTVW